MVGRKEKSIYYKLDQLWLHITGKNSNNDVIKKKNPK